MHRQRCYASWQGQSPYLNVANTAAPLTEPRVYCVRGLEKLVRRRLDALLSRRGIGHVCQVNLSREQRLVTVRLEAAAAAGECRGKTQARDDRRLFDDHRCQAIDAVDHEIRRDRKGQTKNADDVFDDLVRLRGQ